MAIYSYKGMDENMQCRGFQYEIGGKYENDGAKVCEKGYHACKDPLDVFRYYSPSESRYFKVEQSGLISESPDDSKIASSKIEILEEIGISGVVDAHVNNVIASTMKSKENTNTGDYSAATNTGSFSAVTNTGDYSAATNTGDYSAAVSIGNNSSSDVSGMHSVAASFGFKSKAKASRGCAIVLVERGGFDGEIYPLLAIKAAIVDGVIIKEDTWYTLENGEFVEVTE